MAIGHTKIPYLERLWHPTTGCGRGCPGCWAQSLVIRRLAGTMKGLPSNNTGGGAFRPTFHADRLADPLRAKKPQVIGVSFLGDLFDPGISSEQIAAVFGVMAASRHTFIVLTKQAERMAAWGKWVCRMNRPDDLHLRGGDAAYDICQVQASFLADDDRIPVGHAGRWPLPNVWLGVSVTNQADADERLPHLLRTPAAHRWVSVEPMVGPIDLTRIPLLPPPADELDPRADLNALTGIVAGPDDRWPRLDLVICGGQSGPGAVPFDDDWARSLRDQCAAAGVPFYFKQRSGMHPEPEPELAGVRHTALPWRAK